MSLAISPSRIWLLMRHDLISQRKSLVITAATLAGLTIVFYLLGSIGTQSGDHSMFIAFLFVGGYIASAAAFSDFHDPKSGINYLMLPGSSVEKYITRLLLTSVGWTVGVVVVYTLGTVIGAAFASIYATSQPGVFLPVGRQLWTGIGVYLLSQSVFLFGSVYFRKVAVLKVLLSTVVVGLLVSLLAGLTARVSFGRELLELMFDGNDVGSAVLTSDGLTLTELAATRWLPTLQTVGNLFSYVISPLFFWIAGVVRLSETEV